MPDNRQPRHTIRAQGRAQLGERAKSQSLNTGTFSASGPTEKTTPLQTLTASERESLRLLDYLSQSAAATDRTILDRATTDAVVSSSSAAQLLEAWFNGGVKKNAASSSAAAASSSSSSSSPQSKGTVNSNGAGAGGDDDADGDDGLELINSGGYWPGGMYDSQSESNAGRYPGNYSGGYFGTGGGAAKDGRNVSRRVQREIDGEHDAAGGPSGPGAYLRRLRREVDKSFSSEHAGYSSERHIGSKIARCGSTVEVTEEASGSRTETFPTGARVLKDALGHVREIVSAGGVTVVFKYNEQGHLSAFVRTDAGGTIHSLAEVDKHGVILRDSGGRVKAQGESMQVDACGCVSIARQDGQFWSLDLVRNVNIERRLLPDEHGNWFSMTALFSSDGFRMATRFRKVKPEDLPGNQDKAAAAKLSLSEAVLASVGAGDAAVKRAPAKRMVDGTIATLAPGRIDFLSDEDSGTYRFYGRDGSIVDFASDDELKQLKPSRVMASGSRDVEAAHRGKRQAGTAWEALREYVFNYLAAL